MIKSKHYRVCRKCSLYDKRHPWKISVNGNFVHQTLPLMNPRGRTIRMDELKKLAMVPFLTSGYNTDLGV